MKSLIQGILSVFVVMTTLHVQAESIHGGMSGGGGNAAPGERITERDVIYGLHTARLELYMYFSRLSNDENVSDPLMGPLKDKMLSIIEGTSIHASAEGCKDKDGNFKDGSIYSPHANAICISLPNMTQKLRSDNRKQQLLALVAHEYSHLAGTDEKDAVAVQSWVLNSFSRAMGDLYGTLEQVSQSLRWINSLYNDTQNAKDWNAVCFKAMQMDKEFSSIRDSFQSSLYSAFDRKMATRFSSYQLRDHLLMSAACGMSDFHPNKEQYKINYEDAFGADKQRLDVDLEKSFWGTSGVVAGDVMISKIETVADALQEMQEIARYAQATAARLGQIKNLSQEPKH